jgi:hypothetical protein
MTGKGLGETHSRDASVRHGLSQTLCATLHFHDVADAVIQSAMDFGGLFSPCHANEAR